MNVVTVPKQVIKELALEYQNTNSGETFKRILIRVDRLIQWYIKRMIHRWRHLEKVDSQDLYQSALIGLANGIQKIKPSDTPDQAISKLTAYIQCWLKHEFPHNPFKYHTTEEAFTEEPVYRQLESQFLQQVYHSLIDEGVISDWEYRLLQARYVHELDWKTVAGWAGMSVSYAKQIAYAARNRMRHQLRCRGITGED